MQVMPFWLKLIGDGKQNLFNLRTNLRYGCTILRHYLDIERGETSRALARYNGSLGKSRYPDNVLRAWAGDWDFERGRSRVIITPIRYLGDG
jgi:soluble lytic murein transglycosylase-like protein